MVNNTIEYLDEEGLQTLLTNLIQKLDERYSTKSNIQIIAAASAPTGDSNTLWLNTDKQLLYMYQNNTWVPLGAAWK